MSIPALMNADKVVLLPQKEETDKIIISTLAGVISLNGMELNFDETTELFYKNNNDVLMVPLRKVAEKLGYKVTWIHETSSVEISKGDKNVNLQISNKVYQNNNEKNVLKDAPELKNSKTFVPISFLKELLGIEVLINDGHV
jgi:hypothetical protein